MGGDGDRFLGMAGVSERTCLTVSSHTGGGDLLPPSLCLVEVETRGGFDGYAVELVLRQLPMLQNWTKNDED